MKIKNMRNLASRVTIANKGKSRVKIGDVREILAKLSDLLYAKPEVLRILLNNGARRSKRK